MKILLILLALAQVAIADVDYRIYVNKKTNSLVVTQGSSGGREEIILASPISLGGDKTPDGIYTVGVKEAHTFSHKFSREKGVRLPMVDCLRLRGSGNPDQEGVCIHQGDTGDGSHGCIRCPRWTAMKLFQIIPIGTKVIVGDNNLAATFSRWNKETIWVKAGIWPASPNEGVSKALRPLNKKGGGSQAGMNPTYILGDDALVVILGRQCADKGWFERGEVFEMVSPAVKAFVSTLPKGRSGMRRYYNAQTGKVGFLFDGGDYTLWYSLNQVNDHLVLLGLKELSGK